MANPYQPSVILCRTTGTGVQPAILDIGSMGANGFPPVLQIVISATGTVQIQGALDITQDTVPQLVDPIDVTGGGVTASDFYDLIPGLRFYRVNITANGGTVTVKAGAGRGAEGATVLPNLVMSTNTNQTL